MLLVDCASVALYFIALAIPDVGGCTLAGQERTERELRSVRAGQDVAVTRCSTRRGQVNAVSSDEGAMERRPCGMVRDRDGRQPATEEPDGWG